MSKLPVDNSRTNFHNRQAVDACHIRCQTSADSQCALTTCYLFSPQGRGLPFRGGVSRPSECKHPGATVACRPCSKTNAEYVH